MVKKKLQGRPGRQCQAHVTRTDNSYHDAELPNKLEADRRPLVRSSFQLTLNRLELKVHVAEFRDQLKLLLGILVFNDSDNSRRRNEIDLERVVCLFTLERGGICGWTNIAVNKDRSVRRLTSLTPDAGTENLDPAGYPASS